MEWFKVLLLEDQRDDTVAKFNALTDEQKQELLNCFDDDVDMAVWCVTEIPFTENWIAE